MTCNSCKKCLEGAEIIDIQTYPKYIQDIQDICRNGRYITSGNRWNIVHKNINVEFKSDVISFSDNRKDIFIISDVVLGKGAFGVVKMCINILTHKKYAIKIQKQISNHDLERVKVQVDSNKLFGIGSNSSEIFGPFFDKNTKTFCYVMPIAECSFFDLVAKRKISLIQVLTHVYNIVMQIDTMHAHNKVHMDIKLDNILIIDGKAYISDFGVIKTVGEKIQTRVLNGKNKSIHMPPECFFSESQKNLVFTVNKTIDYWSIGVMIDALYKCFGSPVKMNELMIFVRQKLIRTNPKNRKDFSFLLGVIKKCMYDLYINL